MLEKSTGTNFVRGGKVKPCMLGDLFFRIKQYFTQSYVIPYCFIFLS